MNTGSPTVVRPWLLVVLGLVIFIGSSIAVGAFAQSFLRARDAKHAAIASAREKRQQPRVRPVPTPVPQSLPLLGPPGTDADGYPLQHVDRIGLRALLAAGEFKRLTSYFEQLQSAFEADPRKEYWPSDAAASFESAEPETLPKLDAWVAATPDSFAPYLARGCHWNAVASARRGTRFADETPEEDTEAMEAADRRAAPDFEKARALRPGLVAAISPSSDEMRGRAFAACAGCLQIRMQYLSSLTPRWGGSYEAIENFVATLSPRDNPRFRALAGYADYDRAELTLTTREPTRFARTLVDVDRALTHGDYWEYLYLRAQALRGLGGHDDEALVMLNRADALRPMNPEILGERAALHANRNEWIPAGRDLLMALRIEPTEPNAKRYVTDILNGLLTQARASAGAGKRQDALDSLQVVLDMCPDHRAALALRTELERD